MIGIKYEVDQQLGMELECSMKVVGIIMSTARESNKKRRKKHNGQGGD